MSKIRAVAMATLFTIALAAPVGTAAAQSTSAPKNYMVFFDREMTTMTREAEAVLDEAADQLKKRAYSHILIDGYTDRLVGPRQSLALSTGMVASVRAYLVKKGARADAIRTKAWGSASPMRSTGPGVSEPLNRRVVIRLVWE